MPLGGGGGSKPPGGFTRADLNTSVLAGVALIVSQTAAGEPWLLAGTSTVATAANRPTGTLRIFIGFDVPHTELRDDNDLVVTL